MLPIPDTMPQTQEEYDYLVNAVFQNGQEQYANDIAAAREGALAAWDSQAARKIMIAGLEAELAAMSAPESPLPDDEYKRLWTEGVARIDEVIAAERERLANEAAAMVQQPQTLAEIEAEYSCYRPQTAPELPEQAAGPVVYKVGGQYYSVAAADFIDAPAAGDRVIELLNPPTLDNLKETLAFNGEALGDCLLSAEEIISRRRDSIDADTSAKILGGFDYEIGGELLHFSYDAFDQQNFADTANACLMKQAGAEGLPDTITWNAYRHGSGELVRLELSAAEFLELYARGALSHKAACMEAGGMEKAQLGVE